MPPSISSKMPIATTATSTGFVGTGHSSGTRFNMSRGSVFNAGHPSPGTPPPLHAASPSITINPSPKATESSTSMPPPSTNSIYQSATTNSTASSSQTSGGSCFPTHSGSDEEQQQQQKKNNNNYSTIDERKQKRMLSNRESARRSRMRKQQHLDGLRAQIVQLRGENNHIHNQFNFAQQRYLQLEEENRTLRSYAFELHQKFQALGMAMEQAGVGGGLQSMGFDSEFLNSTPMQQMDSNPL
uniref:TSA: Wollemia nobilis Ref_Wollemi_Transcript_5460_974 transcribed RNA sequence n=2 Tax=Wollemia nobilis TaxID=56998 RepID=A0A0C9S879_9CONI